MKIADEIFKCIFNERVWISFTISLEFVPRVQLIVSQHWLSLWIGANRREAITRINADPVHRPKYTALGVGG